MLKRFSTSSTRSIFMLSTWSVRHMVRLHIINMVRLTTSTNVYPGWAVFMVCRRCQSPPQLVSCCHKHLKLLSYFLYPAIYFALMSPWSDLLDKVVETTHEPWTLKLLLLSLFFSETLIIVTTPGDQRKLKSNYLMRHAQRMLSAQA